MERLAESAGGRTIRLPVAGAFHTVLMKPADEALARALAGVELRPPRLPVWSNVDAAPHTDPDEIRHLLVRQVVQPVLWEQTLRNLLAAGFDRFYEIGPGRVLAGHAQACPAQGGVLQYPGVKPRGRSPWACLWIASFPSGPTRAADKTPCPAHVRCGT